MAAGGDAALIAPGSSSSSPLRGSGEPRKSPPLAFEKTSNDALAPLMSHGTAGHDLDPFTTASPAMGDTAGSTAQLHIVIDKQSNAIEALHTAFAFEREAWSSERKQLFQRISKLEKLLRAQNGHSPAKSPTASPAGSLASPQSRALTNNVRLPSIAEDENIRTLSRRREHAPRSITIPSIAMPEAAPLVFQRNASAGLSDSVSAQLDELSVSPPRSATALSPPPLENRVMAGHTPSKASIRPPTPPPQKMTFDGIEDTPTRNNTHINSYLTRSSDEEDEDVELKGPLNMPELPGQPTADNFTEDMLFKKLEQIAREPETNRPTIFAVPSPGLALPDDELGLLGTGLSPKLVEASTEGVLAPMSTRDQTALSEANPSVRASSTTSPQGIALSQQSSHDTTDHHHHKFEQGGIKLKKKPSSNFGAPFGQLGGFGGLRKMSTEQ